MNQPWTIESLTDWAIKSGLQPRLLGTGNGVIVSPTDERKALFTISIAGINPIFSAEIAINPDNIRAVSLQELLQEQYDVAEPKASHKWPRIGLQDFHQSVLENIADWAAERIITPGSPAPVPVATPGLESDLNQEEDTPSGSMANRPPVEKTTGLNKWLFSFLSARAMPRPDGRPLYAYKTTDEEFERIKKQLQLVAVFRGHRIFRKDGKFDALFVLFAAEWWRREYHGGPWSWLPIYEAAGLDGEAINALQTSPQQLLYPALEHGFRYWKREIYSMDRGRAFIGSIAAEGGLPLNLLNDPHTGLKRFFKHLLDRYLPVRASGVPASQVASELKNDLPASFRRETVFRVAGEIVETTLDLRAQYGLAGQDDPVAHLDKVYSEWRVRFSLSLDNEPAQALLRALVVDAAKSSDTGLPLSLSRYIVTESEGKYRLQAAVDIARKVSTASLSRLFGEVEWPSQLEIWLIRPFKARLALLSRIDDEHFKVRNDGVNWRGNDAGAEAAVALFSYGSALSDVRLLPESLMEESLPWIFVEKDNHRRYLGQGGMSLAAESVILVVPQGVGVVSDSDEATPETLGEVEGIGRTIYQGSGLLQVCSNDGEFSIRTRQSKLGIPQYELMGKRLYKDANVRQVFLGAPKLRRRDVGGGCTTLSSASVQWRHAGNDEAWQPWSNMMQGVVDLKAMDGREVLFRSRVGVLSEKTEFLTSPGQDWRTGEITVSGLPNVRFATATDGLDIDISTDDNGKVKLALTRTDESQSSFPLQIQWPQLPHALQLVMPIPVAGAQFRGATGRWLEDRVFLSAFDLAGIHAVGFNHSGGAPESFRLDINIKARDLSGNDLKTLSSCIPLTRMGQVSELPLIQLREQFLQLFSLSEDLDCRLELTLEGNRTYRRLQVARYTYQLNVEEQVVGLESAEYRGMIEQEVVDDLRLEAHSLLNPIERGRELEPCLTQGVPTGEWYRPANLNPGPWLVMPGKDQVASVRPAILVQPGYEPSENGRLRDAIAVANERERREYIGECLTQMTGQYGHKDWRFVFETLEAFPHLPATTLDLWDCFARNPCAMAMLLIEADETNYQKVIDLANELPFMWELVPFNAWLTSLSVLSDYIKQSAPEDMAEMLLDHTVKQKLGFVSEADSLLEKVTWILSEITLKKPVAELKEARPYSFPGVIDGALNSASDNLRGRQGENVHWPDFYGKLIEKIQDASPESMTSLYTQQAVYMEPVLHAPVAMAIRAHILQSSEINRPTNTELYQLQLIRRFDEQWYKDAFELTVLYLYATEQLSGNGNGNNE